MQAKHRTGGSALAQVYNQLGDQSPDVRMAQVKLVFEVTQQLVAEGAISAGHDISDGGIAVALLEMAFAGVAGIQVDLPKGDVLPTLYAGTHHERSFSAEHLFRSSITKPVSLVRTKSAFSLPNIDPFQANQANQYH